MRSLRPDRLHATLGAAAAAALGCAALSLYGADVQWEQLAPGVRTATLTLKTSRRRPVAATVVVADPRRLTIRVVDVYQTLGSESAAYRYSLDDVFAKLGPLAAINGGPTDSFTLPIPVGLLISDGNTRAPLNRKAGDKSGFICFPEAGNPRMGFAYKFTSFNCGNAVQSAPLLFLDRVRVVSDEKEKQESRRSVVGFTAEAEVAFLQTDPISFPDLAQQLAGAFPVSLHSALCLDGSGSSGLIFRSGAGVRRAGSTGNLIASAITIELPKRRR